MAQETDSQTPTDSPTGLPASASSAIASRESVALLRLLTSARLMSITIKERATYLRKTTDWERLEDAMNCAEKVLADYTQNTKLSDAQRSE